MGRKNKKRGGAKPRGPNWGTKNKREVGPTGYYEEVVKENVSFETYYKAQKIVPEEEWDSFISILKEPLPTSFRISGHLSQAKALLKIIEGEYFKDLTEDLAKPECLAWYPNRVGWQLNLTRRDIRKSEANVKLHNFLVSETETGSITRQETVSMIPPLVLDVQSHHKVLDMCAAPGSKTSQLIEMLHSEEGKIPEGFVVANDANNKRCYMLVHQLKRLESPNVVITNHDATIMPNITITKPGGAQEVMKFDRILCDVPCSGDGTMRKNLDVWSKWNTANSISLHGIQYRIARRGLEMLAVGGKLVYSTCSLNPMEDEAVLHRLLVDCGGSLELVDASDKLPGLKFSRGISTWTVMSRDLTIYNTPEDVPEDVKGNFRPHIFPPKPEDASKFHFERCIRVLPHHQNTGGFFVAVLRKTGPLPWESVAHAKTQVEVPEASEVSENVVETPDEDAEAVLKDDETADVEEPVKPEGGRPRSPLRKRRKIRGFKEEPYYFFEPKEEQWSSIKEFYGISDAWDHTLLFSRCLENRRNIYFTTPAIRDMVKLNMGKLTIINTGVKMFIRSDNKGVDDCAFRVAQEGANLLMNYMNKRCVEVKKEDIILLLENDDMDRPPEIHKFTTEVAEKLHTIGTGCIIVEYIEDSLHIIFVAWKGKTSVRAYVPKCDRIHYLRLCGGDPSKFEVNKFTKDRENGTEDRSKQGEDEPKIKEEDSKELPDECAVNTA